MSALETIAKRLGELRGTRSGCHGGSTCVTCASIGAEIAGLEFAEKAITAEHRDKLPADATAPGQFDYAGKAEKN